MNPYNGAFPSLQRLRFSTPSLITMTEAALASMAINLFRLWEIGPTEQAVLLGFPPECLAALARDPGASAAGDRSCQIDRLGVVLEIHKSLRVLFPHNRELAYRWMSTGNAAFDGDTPVEVIKQAGAPGLLAVRAYLERARNRA